MRRHTALTLVSAGLAAALLAACGRPTWTTGSEEARDELERCLEADMKLYTDEATEHCKRALELDPDFAAAKVRLAQRLRGTDPARAGELFDELRQADLDRLTPRERFLVRYFLTLYDDGEEAAAAVLAEYLDEHADDPFALNISCVGIWRRQVWDSAAACYRRLLEVEPNWVIAQNHLGYIAMAQGRFGEAEEHFRTYHFIAPDQANPHDSMAELLILIGRYDEAEDELEQALAIRPDFCASYEHLIRLYLMQQKWDRALEALERRQGQESCAGTSDEIRCSIAIWREAGMGNWDAAWRVAEEGCIDKEADVPVVAHQAAARSGRMEAARELEARYAKALEEAEEYGEVDRDALAALLAHMEGVRVQEEGDPATAAERFATADHLLRYWRPNGLSIFKLFNQLSLAYALRLSGDGEGEEAVLRRVRSVNPQIEMFYPPNLEQEGGGDP